MNQRKAETGSKIARMTAARLAAVQAVYQMSANNQSAESVIDEFRLYRLDRPVEGQHMVLPDGNLFMNTVRGAAERRDDLKEIIDTFLAARKDSKANNSFDSMEALLSSILLCGAYELLAHHDIDAPVIIADYLEVTHAFFEGGEFKLVNAALDYVKNAVR